MARAKFLSAPAQRAEWMPGRAAERIDDEAGIVGEGRQLRGLGRRGGLDVRILAKARAGLLGLAEAEIAGRDRLDPIGREELAHLAQLAGVVGRDHQPSGDGAMTS